MSETLALDAAWIFAVFLIVVVLAAAAIAGRRVLLDRGGGTVECGLRRPGGTWRSTGCRHRKSRAGPNRC